MRRSKTSTAISPKQLKHFAVAAVALTMLLALFASGEDWGAKAQVEAVQAKNKLIETESEKLGTRKLAGAMKVNKGTASFGDSGSSGNFAMSVGADASGSAPMPAPPFNRQGSGQPPRDAPPVPEPGQTSITVEGAIDPKKIKPAGKQPGAVTDQMRDKAKASSGLRSRENGISS